MKIGNRNNRKGKAKLLESSSDDNITFFSNVSELSIDVLDLIAIAI